MLRKGMWVVAPQGVGILVLHKARRPELHLTNEQGGTRLIVPVDPTTLRQAKLAEIPLPRRPDAQRGAALGYV